MGYCILMLTKIERSEEFYSDILDDDIPESVRYGDTGPNVYDKFGLVPYRFASHTVWLVQTSVPNLIFSSK